MIVKMIFFVRFPKHFCFYHRHLQIYSLVLLNVHIIGVADCFAKFAVSLFCADIFLLLMLLFLLMMHDLNSLVGQLGS